jgi:hypothetical protein
MKISSEQLRQVPLESSKGFWHEEQSDEETQVLHLEEQG